MIYYRPRDQLAWDQDQNIRRPDIETKTDYCETETETKQDHVGLKTLTSLDHAGDFHPTDLLDLSSILISATDHSLSIIMHVNFWLNTSQQLTERP